MLAAFWSQIIKDLGIQSTDFVVVVPKVRCADPHVLLTQAIGRCC